MKNLGIFYDHLDYFKAIGHILWPLILFVVIWYIFPRFGILDQENLATLLRTRVARFFLVLTYQNGKTIPNDNKLYQMAITYTKWP
jgi:hypothetical protein